LPLSFNAKNDFIQALMRFFCLTQVHPGQEINPHEYQRIILIALPSINSGTRDNSLRHDSGNRFGGIENGAINGS